MAEAGRLDYQIDQGSQLEDVLTWLGDDGQPIDLTGYTATLRIGQSKGGEVEIEKALETNTTGAVFMLLTDEETSALTSGPHLYDVRLDSSEGLSSYLVAGLIHVFGRL